jgi:IstB-like ATP binding protein
LPFSQAGGALLFHLLSKLYEHTSVVITGVRHFQANFLRKPAAGCM